MHATFWTNGRDEEPKARPWQASEGSRKKYQLVRYLK